VDSLKDTLQHELDQLAQRWEARRQRPARSGRGEWRHGDATTDRPGRFPRADEDREVVARTSWTPATASLVEAAADLDRLGHTFQLFNDAETGGDAVVWRDRDDRLHLHLAGDASPSLDGIDLELTHGAPALTLPQAIENLDASGLPFVFFVDAATARGAILYHRDDGHLGLVTATNG
jgi:hypothetical protein